MLDYEPQAGSKILISGGGRCNSTNTGTAVDRFISGNCAGYTPCHFLDLAEKHRIPCFAATSRDIVAMLLAKCQTSLAAASSTAQEQHCWPASSIKAAMR